MDSASGVASRNMTAMTNNARVRDFTGGVPLNGADSDRSSHSTLGQGFGNPSGWGGSIWNNNTLSSGFGSTARDNSRQRENSAYMTNPRDGTEGKTGSGSLVASSEYDGWNLNRTPWGENTNSSIPHTRSSAVSPARKRSVAPVQQSQQYSDNSSATLFPVSRTTALGQGPVAKPSKPALDPTIGNFTSLRHVDPLVTNGLSNFAFGQVDGNAQRSETSVGSWPDGASVHSPGDDRRSTAASDLFGTSSAAQSRSGSLPPSRHGEPAQFSQNTDHFARYLPANSRQHSSLSHANGRAFQERNGSMQSDSLPSLGRLSFDLDPEPTLLARKQSVGIGHGGSTYTPSGNESGYTRDSFADAQALSRTEEGAYGHSVSYTPDGYSNGQLNDVTAQLRSFQFDSRSAPNGSAVRQSPFYSTPHTPPVYDQLYTTSRTDQTLSNSNNMAHIQNKLQGIQQSQERRNYINPSQFHQQHFQHLMTANQHRPYGYSYAVPNAIHLNGFTQNFAMPVIPSTGMVPILEPPRGPRDHNLQPESVMSKCLHEFKQQTKTNSRRFDLRDIYDHVVEFSGDQHGSRFIQQKLETANSDEKDRVFKELQGDSLQLMQDVFGNYVIQKFFEHGDQTQKKLLANRMKGHVVQLSLQMYGCRVVQKALEHILTDQQALLVKELEKDVLACVTDQNGNHVIQKAIERVNLEHIRFIFNAFKGQVGRLAVHTYGCRVIQRMLERCPSECGFILQELHAEGSKLISDQYGNYVTQHVIQQGAPEDRAKIIALVKNDLFIFSKHKFASNVVEKCLVHGTDQQRREIMLKVTEKNERGESNLLMLIKDSYGNYVIQRILETLNRKDYEELVVVLKPEMEKAKKSISGKQLGSVEKKMHRFDKDEGISSPPRQRISISSTTDSSAPDVPALTSEAQSPQSSSIPSDSASTADELLHSTDMFTNKTSSTPGIVSIAHAS